MPETRKELEALPGIGAYTAGAILSLAYHQREAILDGNLVRIFSRLYELEFLPTEKNCAEIYWEYAREVADSPKAYMHNEALMELGRMICKTKTPLCETCPLHKECRAFLDGRTAEFPPAKKRTEKTLHGTVLVIESADEKILALNGGKKFSQSVADKNSWTSNWRYRILKVLAMQPLHSPPKQKITSTPTMSNR